MTTIMITASVKLTEEEMEELRSYARENRMTLSDFLRKSIFAGKKKARPKIMFKRHPVSGLWYNAAPGQANPTREELKKIMADFP